MSFGRTISPLDPTHTPPQAQQPAPQRDDDLPGAWLDAWWFDLILAICLVFILVQVMLPWLLSKLH